MTQGYTQASGGDVSPQGLIAEAMTSDQAPISFEVKTLRGEAVFLEAKGLQPTSLPFADGDEVRLKFLRSDGGLVLTCRAFVARVGEKSGGVFMGARLIEPPSDFFLRLTSNEVAPPLVAASDEGIAFTHDSSEEFGQRIWRVMNSSFSQLETRDESGTRLYRILSKLPSSERDLLTAYIKGETQEDTPEHIQGWMLLLSTQISLELQVLRKVSRATLGALSQVVEALIAEYQETLSSMEQAWRQCFQKLSLQGEGMEIHTQGIRKLGLLERSLEELRLFHMAQVLRDTLESPAPRPLETLWAVAPRSLESYWEVLSGERPDTRRSKRPEIFEKCKQLYEKWKEELSLENASNDSLMMVGQGLALSAKMAVESIGIRYLAEERKQGLFRHHIERLHRENHLAYEKLFGALDGAQPPKDSLLERYLREVQLKLNKAETSLAQAVGMPTRAQAVEEEVVRYERTSPKKIVKVDRALYGQGWRTQRSLTFLFTAMGLMLLVWGGWTVFGGKRVVQDLVLPLAQSRVVTQDGLLVVHTRRASWLALSDELQKNTKNLLITYVEKNGLNGAWVMDEEFQRLAAVTSAWRGKTRIFEPRNFLED